MKNWTVKNIARGIITTLVGVALVAMGLYLVYKAIHAETWENMATMITEGLMLIGTGAWLLGIEDPSLPRRPMGGGGAAAVILLFALLATGCVTQQRCLDKYGSDTVTVTLRDTLEVIVPIPADTLTGALSDSLLQQLKAGRIDTVYREDADSKIKMKFWRNKYNSALAYMANIKPDTVIEKEPYEVQVPCPEVMVVDPKELRWYEEAWQGFQFFSAILTLLGVLLIILRMVIKRVF
jgi:hypothetical protein